MCSAPFSSRARPEGSWGQVWLESDRIYRKLTSIFDFPCLIPLSGYALDAATRRGAVADGLVFRLGLHPLDPPPCGERRARAAVVPFQSTRIYFRLLHSASGQEIVDCWGLKGPLQPHSPLEKVGGEAPPCACGLCSRWGPFRSQQSPIFGPQALFSNLK